MVKRNFVNLFFATIFFIAALVFGNATLNTINDNGGLFNIGGWAFLAIVCTLVFEELITNYKKAD